MFTRLGLLIDCRPPAGNFNVTPVVLRRGRDGSGALPGLLRRWPGSHAAGIGAGAAVVSYGNCLPSSTAVMLLESREMNSVSAEGESPKEAEHQLSKLALELKTPIQLPPREVYRELIRQLHKQSKLINSSLSRSVTSPVRHEVWLWEDRKKGNKEVGLLAVSFPCSEGGAASELGELRRREWRHPWTIPPPTQGWPRQLWSWPVPQSPAWGLVHVCSAAQSCPTLCDPMNCSPPSSSAHGSLQTSGLPCPPPGHVPNPGMEPMSPASSALQLDSSLLGNPTWYIVRT